MWRIFVTLLFLYPCLNSNAADIAIIPQPQSIHQTKGVFVFPRSLTIVSIAESQEVREYLTAKLSIISGLQINNVMKAGGQDTVIELQIQELYNKEMSEEGYFLTVSPDHILIKANRPAGLFYGIQTLLQLMPTEIFGAKLFPGGFKIPCVEIKDFPRFAWRGMHLDVSRHFFPPAFIKEYIDLMASHKYNVFHWHLTDDQGWRIEIKRYPELTKTGAWRKEEDGNIYGGYYTQDEIRDIVDYARSRFITIVPEIELPGHSSAAIASYPFLGCTDKPIEVSNKWGIRNDLYCPKEETFEFLENVLDEVTALFPGEYIHIGGDEAPKYQWNQSAVCKEVMQREGLKSYDELQSYFIRRIEKYLLAKNKKIIGWDEILEGGLAESAIVMSWRGEEGGIAAAGMKHHAIMTPNSYCYFDFRQTKQEKQRAFWYKYSPLSHTYSYEPIPTALPSENQHFILGSQGNVWTEYLDTKEKVEFAILPRMCALAEVLWSKKEQRNLTEFLSRLQTHFKRLDAMEVNYCKVVE